MYQIQREIKINLIPDPAPDGEVKVDIPFLEETDFPVDFGP